MLKYALMFTVMSCSLILGCGSTAPEEYGDEIIPGSQTPTIGFGSGSGGTSGVPGTGSRFGDPDAGALELDGEAGEDDTTEGFTGYTSFPSAEIGVSILSPTPHNSTSVQKASVGLSGLTFGSVDSIHISCSCGDELEVTPSAFWGSPPLTLLPGDNEITVTATGEDGSTTTDSVTVSYTPFFEFVDRPEARPSTLWVDEPTSLFFSVPMPLAAENLINTASVTLVQVDKVGNPLAEWAMKDDGLFASSGDEVGSDGVYSVRMTVTHPTAESLRFRVRVLVSPGNGEPSYQAYSAYAGVDALERFTVAECKSVELSLSSAQDIFDQGALAVGYQAAEDSAFNALSNDPNVLQVGRSSNGYGAWALFASGVIGFVHGNEPGTRGGTQWETSGHAAGNDVPITSRDVQVLSPFAKTIGGTDESVPIADWLEGSSCPPFKVDYRKDEEAGIAYFQEMNGAGISAIVTHGVVSFRDLDPTLKTYFNWEHDGSQVVLVSGETLDCASLETAPTTCTSNSPNSCGPAGSCIYTEVVGTVSSGVCQDNIQGDLKMGRLAMSGSRRLGVLPSFFRKQSEFKGFPDSLVYLGACDSLWNGSLSGALYLSGARGIAGYTGTVSSAFANTKGQELFSSLLDEKKLLGTALITEQDPDHPEAWFRLMGATNLDVNQSDIINPDFEIAPKKLTGWTTEGDARVVSQLGDSTSVLGKYMGIVSTGLGYTQEIGELSQTFCVPGDITKVSFWWKFYSEEFIEFCGSAYQDAFEGTMTADIGGGEQVLNLVSTNIDKLCPPDACSGCGEMYESLVESSVLFDQDGVWNTEWRQVSMDISQFSGQGPVTLRFFTGDKTDTLYDTAILIDSLVFE